MAAAPKGELGGPSHKTHTGHDRDNRRGADNSEHSDDHSYEHSDDAAATAAAVAPPTPPAGRVSMCFATALPGRVLHGDQSGFAADLRTFYHTAESDANERLVHLKTTLQNATDEQFWALATEGMAELTGAQYAFVSKRILHSDHDVPVEMPPIGTKGSCLMGLSYYYNDKIEQQFKAPDECAGALPPGFRTGIVPDVKYEAYAAPCAYMKHDKVFIIPGNGATFVPHEDNPNAQNLVCPMVSYLGIPLFSEGKCFAHFGVAWGPEGERHRELSWGFLEAVMHSLEDLILHRILHGSGFSNTPAVRGSKELLRAASDQPTRRHVVPHRAIAGAQSLKPYARSLSHELRTPMQGVVGMLDLMLATVQESSEGCTDRRSLEAFRQLKEYIESTQDSSRRAIEAADNVVHAYDMNMGLTDSALPDTLFESDDADRAQLTHQRSRSKQPDIIITGGTGVPFANSLKRRHTSQLEDGDGSDSPLKRQRGSLEEASFVRAAKRASPFSHALHYADGIDVEDSGLGDQGATRSPPTSRDIAPGLRHCNLRDLIQGIVADSLKVGGRPEHAVAEATDNGEQIEVAVQQSNGLVHTKHIVWDVDPDVPDTLLIDERDFHKCLSNIFSNAVKFTDEGSVTLRARLGTSHHARYIIINVADSGPGIPEEFRPHLFKPFSREDVSLTRTTEGLGLGLLVARSLARQKLHGDVVCLWSSTDADRHGSEFEMRVPLTPADAISRPATPVGSPSPHAAAAPRKRSLGSPSIAGVAWSGSFGRSSHSPFPAAPASVTSEPREYTEQNLKQVHAPRPTTDLPKALSRELEAQSRDRAAATPSSGTASNTTTTTTPGAVPRRPSIRPRTMTTGGSKGQDFDRDLASKHPLNILVAEDNKINRKLLVSMLKRLGYDPHEAYDGQDAVRQVESLLRSHGRSNAKLDPSGRQNAARGIVDLVLMDLWMPYMDGYEATEKILNLSSSLCSGGCRPPVVLAVSADVTEQTIERVHNAGMRGFMAKPFQIRDVQNLILQYAAKKDDWE